MIQTIKKAWGIPELRKKIVFTALILLIFRIGNAIPVPYVDTGLLGTYMNQLSTTVLSLYNVMSGGAFAQATIFALGVQPYINSSIIIQLLTIAIPSLGRMAQEGGEEGKKKIQSITRYATVAIAIIQGVGYFFLMKNYGILTSTSVWAALVIIVSFIAGSSFVMWMGEQITDKGVGNGISIILLINIISTIPNDFGLLYDKFMRGNNIVKAGIAAIIILAVILFIVVFVIYLQDGERRIPVQYPKKVVGRKMVGGSTSSIPLKVNTAGVMPIIFASSIMSLPGIIVGFLGKNPGGIPGTILAVLSSSNWCKPSQPVYSAGLLIYILLVVFFAYFYTSITFNPLEVADNMKKQGGFIPGIRPGKPTSEYLNKILNNVIFIGAVGLIVVAIIPILATGIFGVNVSFGGTSLIIIVGVVLETLKQIESLMLVRHYKGFLND